MSTALKRPDGQEPGWPVAVARGLAVVGLFFVFLVGVHGMGDGFKLIGADTLDAFFLATSNPFIGLMVGVLATTLVQSSSVTTSMIVALVAAPENPLPIANAVPMIMGANIGTTVTNTIVALGHMTRKEEFRRAFAAATCHDFFNFMAVATLLPLELATGYLRRTATYFANLLGEVGGVTYDSPLKDLLKGAIKPVKGLATTLFDSHLAQAIVIVVCSAALIFTALMLLVRTLRSVMQNRVETSLNRTLGRNILLSVLVGAIVTTMVQSSSITTALLVPLAGAGIITLREAFPITVGANIGTTVTALLASLAASGPNARAGAIIAFVHLGFNATATLMILPVPFIRDIPIRTAQWLADIAVRNRRWALLYVVFLFYGLPALFAFLFR